MFIRFVIKDLDPGSGRRQGLFQAAYSLGSALSQEDRQRLDDIFDWFNKHLPSPDRFAISNKPHRKAQAISWFKDTAKDHIAQMWAYQRLLSDLGLSVDILRTLRPGYIVYEDEFQVVAYPFADTPS
jgi:hypothetical protein